MGKNVLIIGNGFDLAHGLPTTYRDFLYFGKIAKYFHGINRVYDANPLFEEMEKIATEWKSELTGKHLSFVESICQELQDIKNSKSIPSQKVDRRYNKKYHFSKDMISLSKNLNDNSWFSFFEFEYSAKAINGSGWIDFETEISKVIQGLDVVKTADAKYYAIKGENEFSRQSKTRTFTQIVGIDFVEKPEKFKKKIRDDLNRLIRALELYLSDVVDKLEIKPIQLFEELKISEVMNFNYTHTYERLYKKDVSINVKHMHGECKANRRAELNDMVLGIDDYTIDANGTKEIEFSYFKKYVQRVLKNVSSYDDIRKRVMHRYKPLRPELTTEEMEYTFLTSGQDKGLIEYYGNDEWNSSEESDGEISTINVFGHSLDKTDKDVLYKFLYPLCTRVKIYAKDEDKKSQLVENLIDIVGAERLIMKSEHFPSGFEFINQEDIGL